MTDSRLARLRRVSFARGEIVRAVDRESPSQWEFVQCDLCVLTFCRTHCARVHSAVFNSAVHRCAHGNASHIHLYGNLCSAAALNLACDAMLNFAAGAIYQRTGKALQCATPARLQRCSLRILRALQLDILIIRAHVFLSISRLGYPSLWPFTCKFGAVRVRGLVRH